MATLDEEQAAIARRQKIAEMLMQQGVEPLETNNQAGGYVVPVSPLAGVAKVAQALSGAYVAKKADQQSQDLHDKRIAELSAIDFKSPDAANQLAKNGMIEEAIKMRAKEAADKSGTPGQWFIPAGAKPYKDETGMTGYQLPDGSIIPNRFSQTEYQQRMTDPAIRGAVQAAVSGNTVSKATNAQGQDFHDFNKNLNPNIAAGMPGQQQTMVDISPNASPEDRAMLEKIAKETGAVMGQSPSDAAAAKIAAESQAKAATDFPQANANMEYTKGLIDEISNHPGLSSVVGVPGITKWIPGTEAQGFQAKMDQLNGKQFLEAFQSLKGGGQITEVEGKKATDAIAALNTKQSESSFKKELEKLKSVIESANERMKAKATGEQQGKNKPAMSPDDLVKHYLGK